MRIDGIQLAQGSNISNLVIASGTSFPAQPDDGELFYRIDTAVTVKGLYIYISGNWDRIASSDTITVPNSATLPSSANAGDLYYKNSDDSSEGLYAYSGSAWIAVGGTTPSYTVSGDVTGTIDGGTDTLTLTSIGTAGTYKSVTTDAKGRVTAGTNPTTLAGYGITDAQPIDGDLTSIAALSGTSGILTKTADNSWALDTNTYLTENQTITLTGAVTGSGSTSISTSLATVATAGTFGSASAIPVFTMTDKGLVTSVTNTNIQIAESQITDGTLLARIAGNETITGTWTFSNAITGATPTAASHLTTKSYVDNAVLGLTWKRPVRVATTTNITLSGTQTVDGVAVIAGDRVLVKNQTTGAQNGIYVVASGAWVRATDFDDTSPIDEVNSAAVFVAVGTTQSDTGWTQTSAVSTIGTDAMTFVQFSAGGAFTAGAGLSQTGNAFNIGTASTSRIVINADDIDLATVTDSGTGTFKKITTDAYGRVSGTTSVAASDITSLVNSTYVLKTGDTMTGSLTSPSFIPNSATVPTDGLYLPMTNTLGFATNSTEKMRIDGTGNVGIGTGANASFSVGGGLQIKQSGASVLRLTNGTSNFDVMESLVDAYLYNRANGSMLFGTNDTERMRITAGGLVGIGMAPTNALDITRNANASSIVQILNNDTGAAADARFQVSNGTVTGGLVIRGTGSALANNVTLYASGASAPLTMYVNGAERVRVDPLGVTTFGSAAPNAARIIKVAGTTNAGSVNILNIETTSANQHSGITIIRNDNATAPLGATINLARTRGATSGSVTIVQSGDLLGGIAFSGADGTDIRTNAAEILGVAEGTVGSSIMPGRLVFSTTAAGGATPAERMRIDSSGTIIIGNGDAQSAPSPAFIRGTNASGTNIAGQNFTIAPGRSTGTSNGGSLIFQTAAAGTTGATLNALTTRMLIDSVGTITIGTTAGRAFTSGASMKVQVETTDTTAGVSVTRNTADALGPNMRFLKTRGTTVGSFTAVQSGDSVGQLQWFGTDGTSIIEVAEIRVEVDTIPGTNDMPGRMTFWTTPDGSINSVERMRIDNAGNVLVTSAGGLGYGTGSGGAVTQVTSRTTGVTLNKTNGTITLVSAAGSTAWQSFTVTNSTVAATDVVHVNQKAGTDLYMIHVTAVATGSFRISFATTGGTTTEQPVFNFAVIKAVTS